MNDKQECNTSLGREDLFEDYQGPDNPNFVDELEVKAHALHELSERERQKVCGANNLLTTVTRLHSHNCSCVLCQARMLTDVQNENWFIIPNVELEEGLKK